MRCRRRGGTGAAMQTNFPVECNGTLVSPTRGLAASTTCELSARRRFPEAAARSLRRMEDLSLWIAEPARRRNGDERASTMLSVDGAAGQGEDAHERGRDWRSSEIAVRASFGSGRHMIAPPLLRRTGGPQGRGVVNHDRAALLSPKTIRSRPFGVRPRSSSCPAGQPRLALCHPTILPFRSRSDFRPVRPVRPK